MKKFGIVKQRLVLTRAKQFNSPVKQQPDLNKGLKGVKFCSPLKNSTSNKVQKNNSSIFHHEAYQDFDQIDEDKPDMIRAKSLSCAQFIGKNRQRVASQAPFIKQHDSYQRLTSPKLKQSFVKIFSRNFIQNSKENDSIFHQNKAKKLPSLVMAGILNKFGEKLIQQFIRSQRTQLVSKSILSNFTQTCTSLRPQRKKLLQIHQNVSLQIKPHKNIKLSFLKECISFHTKCERSTWDKQMFWKLCSKAKSERITETDFLFILDRLKYLDQQIKIKNAAISKLIDDQTQLNEKMIGKKALMTSYQNKIKEHNDYMQIIEDQKNKIDNYLYSQPNKILIQQAQGYKEKQQELFDLACALQECTPDLVESWVNESIFVPQQSFQLTLRSFPMQISQEKSIYKITGHQIQTFKKSLKMSCDSMIKKLIVMLQAKCSTIKQFVGVMRRLASYTIGKRQYLTEINKKMATISVLTEKSLIKIDDEINKNNERSINLAKSQVSQLKDFCSRMKQIYNQAEVFY